MSTDIRRKHICSGLPDAHQRAYGDVVRCDDCGRFLVARWGYGEMRWQHAGFFLTWRMRRQLRLEGNQ
ncbi:hypothetical protein ACFQ6C_26365 [Streptomyces sp. NPDC056454]|uniref:hypothetical protein n=1 Tax=Streptomyces sp. NPDC056454 TaxID=3345823 RepID=UPI0036CDB17A